MIQIGNSNNYYYSGKQFPQVASLQYFPYSTPMGMKQGEVEDLGMELEEDEVSLEDSEEGSISNDILVFEEDSDQMDSSSVQDISALIDSS